MSFNNCGICGKYYKICRHYCKEHIPDLKNKNTAICGRKNVILLNENWSDIDMDPNDVCKHCAKLDNLFQAKFQLKNGIYQENDNQDFVIFQESDEEIDQEFLKKVEADMLLQYVDEELKKLP